ncbi:Subtilisin-like serine protease domain protein [Mycoplasmoides gallisepticum CA06_2006.052-5-2P]|uniref:Subtilisin-like serine protease domain protein n=1 Tax=Mycoplasmoides gallisepticum WI01_2001.043-13-2P TaxID=1159201 RepID=J3TRN4_MYCGL|nr:Subtilisin-like serine protease domain protein [Mycoplasmoides gallisepticum VA94_7994-1-7P]AFP77062.1 Subtilisin-like serine protease domain protein [Mycoplasmoides gallisepticum NC95_13295-2-2P]AFP77820.1 Subtilisin-like serine protease domain protein [Mycoplasmoides gallisepticum NC96_1596-4-2P]AFP78586.1 Subtilisin-like serine protease domain protein [Mycoplasmoides gallisepticum NY01_2001.047-5-1P]AFP79347.1 Subtilisin-like serine protease domain protein [Mycoplasmoides gallisepticum WI
MGYLHLLLGDFMKLNKIISVILLRIMEEGIRTRQ